MADTPSFWRGPHGYFEDRANRAVGGFFLLLWALFLGAPLASTPGQRFGIFIASAEWNDYAIWEILKASVLGAVIFTVLFLLAAAWFLHASDLAGAQQRKTKKVLFFVWLGGLTLMPLWGLGFERGHLRIWAHDEAPTVGYDYLDATVSSAYQPTSSKGRAYPYVIVQIPPYGRLKFENLPEFASSAHPVKGDTFPVVGRQTWAGTYYKYPYWPVAWLKDGVPDNISNLPE